MSYKPLSQTVTDGQKNPISSDAVHDHVASEISAIPASASLTLDNLTAPTAVNQDLLLDAGKKIRLNASETVNTLLHVKSSDAVGTGVNAVTPSNTGSTVFNTSASISAILSVGDYIKLNGLADIARVTVINSATQITVSPSLGIGGGGTSREIEKIQTSATFRDASNVEVFSVIGNKLKFSNNIIIGDGAGDRLTTTNNAIFIGNSAGRSATTVTEQIAIGVDALSSNSTVGGSIGIGARTLRNATLGLAPGSGVYGSVAIGIEAGQNTTNADGTVSIGYRANRISASSSQSTYVGALAGGGIRQVSIGWEAGGNGTGADNVNVGRSAGAALTTGSTNTLVGYGIGWFGGAFGWQGQTLQTGSNNTIIGAYGAPLLTSTTNAIALGIGSVAHHHEFALGGYYTGNNSGRIDRMFLGRGALQIPFSAATPVKILTQHATGTDAQLTAASLVLAGAAGTGTGMGSAVVLATAEAGVSTGTSVNQHVQRLRVEQDGKVGIGVQNPQANLEVAGKTRLYDGDLEIASLGKGLKIAEGADATMGVVTLAAGTATVSTTAVKSNSRIMLTNQNPGGTVGFLHVSARTADTSFVITSSNAADTSDIAWMIVNPIVGADSDANTFITNASISDATQKRAIQRLVKTLKDESLWSKLKVIYPMVGGTEAAHKLNLKDPQDTDAAFRLTFTGTGVAHNARGIRFGIAPGDTSCAADTKFVPSVEFAAIDNFHISCCFFYDTDDWRGGTLLGATTSGGGNIYFNPDSSTANYVINNVTTSMNATINNFPVAGRPKSSFMLMNSGIDKRGYLQTAEKDLYEVFTRGIAATGALPTHSLMLNGYNNNGTPFVNWTAGNNYFKTIQFVTFGDSLTTIEAYKLQAIIQQFQRELNRQL